MTTAFHHPETTAADTAPFRLPDIPERHPDDMTTVQTLHRIGIIPSLIHYLGNPDTTIISGERYTIHGPEFDPNDNRYPDLLVAFDVNPDAYDATNGYIVSAQGKPPDFILEVASRHTADADRTVKKDDYERLGVAEYWLFDRTGDFYGFRLAGYRLARRRYVPIAVTETAAEVRGFSPVLNLFLRWHGGELELLDPQGNPIPTFASEHSRAEEEAARAEVAEARAEAAEARAQELAAELERLRNG